MFFPGSTASAVMNIVDMSIHSKLPATTTTAIIAS